MAQYRPKLNEVIVSKVEVKLSLCLSKYHIIRCTLCLAKYHDMMYGGVEG